jgi:hypothetical protein
MRAILTTILLVLMLGGTAPAQQGGGQPMGRRGGEGPLPGGGRGLSTEERQEIMKWAAERMPNLHKLITEGGRQRLFRVARMRHTSVRQAENRDDTETLERLLKNIKNEDQVFAYMMELDKAKPEDRGAIVQKIRVTMRAVFDEYLEQRAERLQKLKERLESEEAMLEQERSRADLMVERQMQGFGIDVSPTTSESNNPEGRDVMAAPER